MGVNQDYREAVKYIRQAATGVFPLTLAQYNLAVYYENGLRGLSKDLNMALQFYHRAAAQGFDGAQYNLGVCYYYGEGVDKDIFKALRYYEAASAQGYAQAQSALGQCYLRGIGVKKDRTKAELLFRAAAAQETTERLWNLAWFLKYFPLNGNDKVEAVQLLRSVLEQDSNHPLALYELGHCYHKGLGVSRNVIEAMRYYVKYDCHPLKSLRGYPSFRSDYKAIEVEYKMLKWKNRKDFLMFLVQYQFIYRPRVASTSHEAMTTQQVSDPDIVHTVFYTEDMMREIMSFL